MFITVKLPYLQSSRVGKQELIFFVETNNSELDGKIVTSGVAICLNVDGGNIALPPYISVRDVATFIQGAFGPEFGAEQDSKIN